MLLQRSPTALDHEDVIRIDAVAINISSLGRALAMRRRYHQTVA